MIEARPERGTRFAARLAARAEKLGQAHAESRARRRRRDPLRWRLPGLLWPLFAKER